MKIKVLGAGCKNCKRLYENTKKAVEELGIVADVEYITDITKIVEMGLMKSPILAIDEKPVLVGFIPSVEKIKEIIKENI